MPMRKSTIIALAVLFQILLGTCHLNAQTREITQQETLRGSVTPEREWWDLLHYHLKVEFLPETRRLKGSNTITFKTLKPGSKMQIDLQPPLAITRVTHGDAQLKFEREGNVYWVMFEKELPKGAEEKIEVFYEGVPVVSRNPPWVGGITWGRDDLGEHFIVTTCQGIGASIWWPNKDHGADEPDRGMQISVTVPENLVAVSNGRLKKTDHDAAGRKKTFHWEVTNPINNYAVNVNIANYVHFSEKYQGKGGVLDVDYWVLAHQKEAAISTSGKFPVPSRLSSIGSGSILFMKTVTSWSRSSIPEWSIKVQSPTATGSGMVICNATRAAAESVLSLISSSSTNQRTSGLEITSR
jgi:hypothetical protein